MADKLDALRRTAMFGGLAEQDLQSVAQRASEHRYIAGRFCSPPARQPRGMFVILEGAVQALRESSDGREKVIHIEPAGSTIAEVPVFDEGDYPSTVRALEDTTALFLARQDVRRLCLAHPEIAPGALKLLASRLRQAAALIESLSLRDVDRRLASLLLVEAQAMGQRNGDELTLELRLTHQQMASRIGSVREVVSRAMARLQESGLVRVDGKRVIVPREKALVEFASA
ncbi:MAG: Crp/Fnr family transcriptional regulator [Bryobacteraceae bacterium]